MDISVFTVVWSALTAAVAAAALWRTRAIIERLARCERELSRSRKEVVKLKQSLESLSGMTETLLHYAKPAEADAEAAPETATAASVPPAPPPNEPESFLLSDEDDGGLLITTAPEPASAAAPDPLPAEEVFLDEPALPVTRHEVDLSIDDLHELQYEEEPEPAPPGHVSVVYAPAPAEAEDDFETLIPVVVTEVPEPLPTSIGAEQNPVPPAGETDVEAPLGWKKKIVYREGPEAFDEDFAVVVTEAVPVKTLPDVFSGQRPPPSPSTESAGLIDDGDPKLPSDALIDPPAKPAPAETVKPQRRKKIKVRLDPIDCIRYAMENDMIELFMQPIVRFDDREPMFYEAFTRILDINGDYLLPDRYMKAAVEEGFITPLDNLMLTRAAESAAARRRNGDLETAVFCNVSPHTLADEAFFTAFCRKIRDQSYAPGSVVFEFQQQAYSGRNEQLREAMRTLSLAGCPLSLDHVNDRLLDVEYLSLSGVRFLKIGLSLFLKGVADRGQQLLPDQLRPLLHRYGISLIIERVENEKDYARILEEGGTDYAQGFLFGAPERFD